MMDMGMPCVTVIVYKFYVLCLHLLRNGRNMIGRTSCMVLVLGLGISVSITAVILRILMRKDDDEEDNDEEQLPVKGISLIVQVPKQHVGAIIGRQGNVIKDIQERTLTKITFNDSEKDGDARIATIKGQLENVQEAKALIVQLIEEQPSVETREIFIPSKACGRVIGKNGDNIKYICSASKAKVTINTSSGKKDPDSLQQVIIKGSKEQIENAICMIDEKIAEGVAFSRKVTFGVAGRPLPEKINNHDVANNIANSIPQECLEPIGSDGFLEVFVSAVENPNCFWVQTVSTKSVQLDKMVEEMTEFYSDLTNQLNFVVSQAFVGDIVAAFYYHDSSWYRARVISIKAFDNAESTVEVFYADFGDTATVASNLICRLKSEYANLPTQAIECCLAGVKPEGDEWCDTAIGIFEKLTHVAQWKSVMVKPVTSSENVDFQNKCIPVEIIDTCGGTDTNIAEELVKSSYATWIK